MRAWFAPIPLTVRKHTKTIALPAVTPSDLKDICEKLRAAGQRLHRLSVCDIAQQLEQVARAWLKEGEPERLRALELLPQFLPFSLKACRRALDALMEPLLAERLLKLLDEQLGDHRVLDDFVERLPGIKRRAFGAHLAFLIAAGNIVGIGIWDIVFCLLCKTPVLVKPSSDEPVLLSLFAHSLERIAPELASAVAVIPFPSERNEKDRGKGTGEKDLLGAALSECEVVIVYGTDETVREVKRQAPAKVRIIERGYRFSVAIIDNSSANEQTAELLALDIARFDQRGCLSPQVCFVVGQETGGTRHSGLAFAQMVAEGLKRVSEELPPKLREGEKARVTQFRLTCEMLGATVLSSPDARWTIAVWDAEHKDGWRKVACSARVLHIVAVPSLDKVLEILRPIGKFLQGVALGSVEHGEKGIGQGVWSIAEELGRMGVSRICAVGQLQTPPIEWSQDGKHLVAELVRWCDLEPFPPQPPDSWVEVFCGDEVLSAQVRFALEEAGIPVSIEADIDPSQPTRFLQRLRIPTRYLSEGQRVLAEKGLCTER